MPPLAIIFDFDGVIALSEHVHSKAWIDLSNEKNKNLPPSFIERGVGSSDEELAMELTKFWGEPSYKDILSAKRRYYQKRVGTECRLVPGVETALAYFHKRLPVALATSSCRADIRPLFETFNLERYFTAILTIDDVTHAKPHPEIYLKASERLKVHPKDCWVFEDSIYGTTAARKAGMNIIGITTAYSPEDLAPIRAAFPNFEDLDAIVAALAM